MGTATATPPAETDEEREARLAAEQADLDNDNGAEFEQAGGRVADGQTGAKQVDTPPEELLVRGSTEIQLIHGFGGKKATGSTITLQGMGSIPVLQGQAFDKGQFVRFEGVALIESAEHKDKVDRKAGVAVDSKYAFKAFATDVRCFPGAGPRLEPESSLAERVSTALELLQSDEPDVATVVQLLQQGLDA